MMWHNLLERHWGVLKSLKLFQLFELICTYIQINLSALAHKTSLLGAKINLIYVYESILKHFTSWSEFLILAKLQPDISCWKHHFHFIEKNYVWQLRVYVVESKRTEFKFPALWVWANYITSEPRFSPLYNR